MEFDIQRSLRLLSGQPVPLKIDADDMNAQAIAHSQGWTREAVEAEFARMLATFEQFLKEIPDHAFENEHIHLWLRLRSLDHYEDHRPPNTPSLC